MVGFLFGRRATRAAGLQLPGADGGGQVDKVRVRLPMCAPCAKLGSPEIQHVDFHEAKMSVLVHRDLRKAYRRTRKKRR